MKLVGFSSSESSLPAAVELEFFGTYGITYVTLWQHYRSYMGHIMYGTLRRRLVTYRDRDSGNDPGLIHM
jgi:hypothetical protein